MTSVESRSRPGAGLPLLAHDHAQAVVAWRAGEAVTRANFLADVFTLAGQLPTSAVILNTCSQYYNFAVGLAAAMLCGLETVLPPVMTPEMLKSLQRLEPRLWYLSDQAALAGMAGLMLPLARTHGPSDERVPMIAAKQTVLRLFTSGSSGQPVAHAKRWGQLLSSCRQGAERLGLAAAEHYQFVATVPAQHMYGLELAIITPWQQQAALINEKPFYPADISASLQAVPAPRVLVSTPYHLKNWLDSAALSLPELTHVLSATAPLSRALAQRLEAQTGAVLQEIYGSTETGQIASRRTACEDRWLLYPGLSLQVTAEGRPALSGGHVAPAVALDDQVELVQDRYFYLRGRGQDQVKIAGKRSSLAWLNSQLLAIDGVKDGLYLPPAPSQSDEVQRLAAVVVAPDLTTQAIMQALRARIDPLFLPRPLIHVPAIVRNATGKITQSALAALRQHCLKDTDA